MTQETKIISGISILSLAILIGAIFFLSRPSPVVTGAITPIELLVKSDSAKIASESAQVTIVEFGDYQCPACAQSHIAIKQILKDFPGKVNFVFRHFPLGQHPNAVVASEAAEAAGEQGKFWEMHDLLYTNQSEWSASQSPLDIFSIYAGTIGLNVEQFKQSVINHTYQAKVMADKLDGDNLQVNSTPTFYINGVKMNRSSFSDFKSSIEQVYQ